MSTLDYFLYDNRTWSAHLGRDWGLKAATGPLATRGDLKNEFNRYCDATPGEQNKLAGFGDALGGFRSRAGNGYMLCVTLENSDPYGRPSWTVLGLWCPDNAVLRDVLISDPIGAAKGVLSAPSPPPTIHIPRGAATIRASRRKSTTTTFHRFVPSAAVREATSVLLGAIHDGITLPNILGITGTLGLPALAQAGFDRVYCHPMDERAERIFARQLSPSDLQELETAPAVVEAKRPPRQTTSAYLEPASAEEFRWPALFALSLLGIILAVFVSDVLMDRNAPSLLTASTASAPGSTEAPATPSAPEASPNHQTAIDAIERSLEEFRKLDPNALRQSRSFQIAENVAVLPKEHAGDRKRVQEAYETLFEVRKRMLKRPNAYVAYYYDELPSGTLQTADRLKKIRQILEENPLGGDACATLQDAFGFEFEGDSEVRRWCEASTRLETTLESMGPSAPDSPASSPSPS